MWFEEEEETDDSEGTDKHGFKRDQAWVGPITCHNNTDCRSQKTSELEWWSLSYEKMHEVNMYMLLLVLHCHSDETWTTQIIFQHTPSSLVTPWRETVNECSKANVQNRIIIKMNILPSKILLPSWCKFPPLPGAKHDGYKCEQLIVKSCLIRISVHKIGTIGHVGNTVLHPMVLLTTSPAYPFPILCIPPIKLLWFPPMNFLWSTPSELCM